MSFNLNECTKDCLNCVKGYKKKHRLHISQNAQFEISCSGIPKEYISPDLYQILPEDEIKAAETMLDPVKWAAEVLDWHCLDPNGEVWKRKNPEEYYKWVMENPGESILGKSRYHRPYQAIMLRCSSKYKAFRIGRRSGKTETAVISMLYHSFTKPGVAENTGFKILVLTPYQSQIELIFKRIEELVYSTPETANSVKSKVKSPFYKIEFYNGSIIKGFTAGTKSGGNANAVRGQDANMILFDEADYLNESDIDSALAVIIDHPDAFVWMSSTPSGARTRFYDNCNSPMYKEFHFPSYVNPMWNDATDKYFKSNNTEGAYKHEILADWGEREEGVFQNTYIDNAKAEYRYGDITLNPYWVYLFGVDWNDTKIGTNIAVVGYNPNDNTFYLVDRQVVSRDGWTQLTACQKIADMNRFWRPQHIYIDAGFGGVQNEILRKYGYDSMMDKAKGPGHPDTRLKDIVKAYNFGGKVEIRDLITKQPISKPAKPFLVENTVRRFETGTIKFSMYDADLEKQLLGYVIDHTTTAGLPVYKASDEKVGDHALDALMLALVGFTLEKTEFGKPKVSSDFVFTKALGERDNSEQIKNIAPGIIVTSLEKANPKENLKPPLNRGVGIEESEEGLFTKPSLPAAHTNTSGGVVGLWKWPGFGHDAPKPEIKNTNNPRSGIMSRPKRKNI